MPKFSKASLNELNSCDPVLQQIFNEVIKRFDCKVICGHRTERDQNEAFEKGFSKVKFPNSKHNTMPSKAIDCVPYPINWNNTISFYYFAGFVKGTANMFGYNLRWGGDWDSDNDLKDQTFMDLAHFELL